MLRSNVQRALAVIVLAAGAIAGIGRAQTASPKPGAPAATPKQEEKLALGQNEVVQLLLLMDTDKNGKISKEEYMKFMEAEFERLDKDKNGELDAKELTQSRLRVTQPAHAAPHR